MISACAVMKEIGALNIGQAEHGISFLTARAISLGCIWLHLDEVTGSIEAGKSADMIILNHNLFEIPETDIHSTEVQKTIFKGEVVYERNN